MDAPKDGYTWTAGAAKQLGTYPVLGMINSKVDDFHLFLAVTNVSIVSVNPSSPYQTFPQLLEAMKTKQVSVSTAGNSSSGHFAMEAIARATGVKYRHVTYDGGNPAVVSTVSGETEVTTQLAPEQAEMIKGKRLRPLAVVGDQPLTIEGFGTIPPITQFVKDFPQGHDRLRHLHPQGRAARSGGDGREALGRAHRQVREDPQVRDDKGALFTPLYGAGSLRCRLADRRHRRLPAAGRRAWRRSRPSRSASSADPPAAASRRRASSGAAATAGAPPSGRPVGLTSWSRSRRAC